MDKTTYMVILVFSLLFCPLFVEQALADDKMEREEAAKKLTTLVDLLRDGYATEYEEARGIHVFRNRDGSTVAVTIFTIEGFGRGNNHTQFMAVFATLGEELEDRRPRPLSLLDVAAVGGKGWRGVDPKNVTINGQGNDIWINLFTQEYAPEDALCCPSKKSKAIYVIRPYVRGRLKQLD